MATQGGESIASGGASIPPPASVERPRFAMTAAVGISFDNLGIADGRYVRIPSFAVMGGIGRGRLGFEARLFASEAAGRFSSPNPVGGNPVADVGADRQALDLLLAVRPFADLEDASAVAWSARFLRALTLDVGGAAERVSVGTQSVRRVGAVLGAHVDLPLTPPGDSSELCFTVSVRRVLGTNASLNLGGTSIDVGDSRAEVLAGLTVVF
jgi:hypothetical protein